MPSHPGTRLVKTIHEEVMKEKLYAEYVKRTRLWGLKLRSSDDFFAAVEEIKGLCGNDPLECGLAEDAWELLLS
jgi:hypothetical protein